MNTFGTKCYTAVFGFAFTAAVLLGGCTPAPDAGRAGEASGNGIIARAPVATSEELETSRTAQAIRERGVLLNGTEVGLPLLSQRNPATGSVTGFDAMLAKMLAKYIIGDPSVKQVTATGATRESLLQVGTVDTVVHAYTMTEERAKKVSFAGPYLISGASMAVLKPTAGVAAPADMNGETVAAISGSTHIDAIKKVAPEAEIITFRTAPQATQALESGKADVYVHDLTILAGTAAVNNKIEIVGKPFTEEPYGIGIANGDAAFKRFIEDWLVKIEKRGLWKQAWKRTLGQVAGKPPEPPKIQIPPKGE